MAKSPPPPSAIVTLRLPVICPACACRDLTVRPAFLDHVVACQRPCGWFERYHVVDRMPEPDLAVKGGEHLAFKKRHRKGPHR